MGGAACLAAMTAAGCAIEDAPVAVADDEAEEVAEAVELRANGCGAGLCLGNAGR